MAERPSAQEEPDCSVEHLDPYYRYADREEIARFAQLCPALVPLLLEAAREIGKYFDAPELVLEVVEGLTADEQALVVSINTDLPPEEAMVLMDRFDEEWWVDVQDRAQGRVCIDVEFR